MRTPFRLLALLFCLLGSVVHGAEPTNAPAPVRVVSQTVGTDELLLALAEPGQIAALSHLARRPEFSVTAQEAEAYPQISIGDAETILKFNPTLVLCADYSRTELVAQLRRAGVEVLLFDRYKTLADSYANLRLLARELGAEEKAEAVIADCERRVAALRTRLADAKPVRVVAPSIYGLLPGTDTTFDDLCTHAGAENLGATLGHLVGHAPVPTEQMITWPVDKVVVMGDTDPVRALEPYRDLLPYKFMAAVREGRVALLSPPLMSCVTHRRIDAYEQLARQLHPELFP